MKKETLRNILLLIIVATGALLIGFNAGQLSNSLNALLFVVGVVLLSMSTTLLGLFETLWKKKK